MDMVDGAFERVDVGLFKSGIDYDVVLYRGKNFSPITR